MNLPWEAIIALVVYIIGSTIGFVWWMATQTITLQFVREDLAAANKLLNSFDGTYAKNIEMAREISRLDLSIRSAHNRIDEIKK